MKILKYILSININEDVAIRLSNCRDAATLYNIICQSVNTARTKSFNNLSENGISLECEIDYDDILDVHSLNAGLSNVDGSVLKFYTDVIVTDYEMLKESFDGVWSISDWTKAIDEIQYSPKLLSAVFKYDSSSHIFPASTYEEHLRIINAIRGLDKSGLFIDDRGETFTGDFLSNDNIKARWDNCFCNTTDCVATGSLPFGDNKEIFTDLRFDTENNQFDMQFGVLDEDCVQFSDWSSSINISFCPYCGIRLPKVN